MNLELIKKLYNLHVIGFEQAFCNVNQGNSYDLVYNNSIHDYYDNFVSNFSVNNFEDFQTIINQASKELENVDRKTVVYLLPFMEECYNNKEKYFNSEKFELIATEVWQIFTDFEKLDNIKTNCDYKVELELPKNMEEYALYMLECFKSDADDDPYGGLDEGYGKEYANFKSHCENIKCECFLIKANGKVVGVSQCIYDRDFYGIYGFAIHRKYRNKGIGKKCLLEHLKRCKDKGISMTFLQTEEGFYPHKMYKKLGFQDLFNAYYYLKK